MRDQRRLGGSPLSMFGDVKVASRLLYVMANGVRQERTASRSDIQFNDYDSVDWSEEDDESSSSRLPNRQTYGHGMTSRQCRTSNRRLVDRPHDVGTTDERVGHNDTWKRGVLVRVCRIDTNKGPLK